MDHERADQMASRLCIEKQKSARQKLVLRYERNINGPMHCGQCLDKQIFNINFFPICTQGKQDCIPGSENVKFCVP